MDSLQIRLLGKLEVLRDGRRLSLPGRKTQALLVYLAVQGEAHQRRRLFDLFCANAEDPAAALRWHLSRLRQTLGTEAILSEEDRVWFNPTGCQLDCVEFERVLNANLVGQNTASITTALDLYRGELSSGLSFADSAEFELWLLSERTRFNACYERGLQELIARLIATGDYEASIQRARQLVQNNPLQEQAHAHLIWLYGQTGQIQAAIQQYETCREILKRELAVEPMPNLNALYKQVRSGKLSQTFPIPASLITQTPDLRQTINLVGREAELDQLNRAWQEAAKKRGSVVLVQAEAGGGKSRLIREFAWRTSAMVFLYGQCYESTRRLPYHPWIELLEARLADLGDATLNGLSPFWLEQLQRLLPSLAGRSGIRAVALPPLQGDESERLFHAVYEFLFRQDGFGLQMIFIDDLQWADEASLQLFHFLARRILHTRALLIGAYRSEEAEVSPALEILLAELSRGPLQELRLPPLTQDSIAALVGSVLPDLPPNENATVSEMLAHATGGNPHFVTEVLRELAQKTTLPATLPVPASVRDLIHRRLSLLPESTRQVIEAIAIFDEPITIAQAQDISARTEEETTEAVDLGLRARLLLAKPGGSPARYDFSHDLVRESIVSQLGILRCRTLHHRAAGMLTKTVGYVDYARRLELAGRIVHHAEESEDFETVLNWSALAGEHAEQLCAFTDALSVYTSASFALNQLRSEGKIEPTIFPAHEMDLLLKRTSMFYRLGKRAEEAALLEQAGELLEGQPDEHRRAAFHLRHAAYLNSINQYPRGFDQAQIAIEIYRRSGDKQRTAESLEIASSSKQSVGELSAAWQLMEEANQLYKLSGDVRSENRTRVDLAWCLIELSEIGKALEHLSHARDIAEKQGDKLGCAFAYFVMAVAWNLYCCASKIRENALSAQRLYQELGNESLAARADMYIAISYWYENNFSTAQTLFTQAFMKAQETGEGWVEGWSAHVLGRLEFIDNQLDGAERWFQHALELRRLHVELTNQISDLAWLGRLRLVQGQIDQALTLTEEAIARLAAVQSEGQVWEVWDIWMCHAEVLAAVGKSAEAAEVLQRSHAGLLEFAAKISDLKIRQVFLHSFLNARILAAHSSGEINPFPG